MQKEKFKSSNQNLKLGKKVRAYLNFELYFYIFIFNFCFFLIIPIIAPIECYSESFSDIKIDALNAPIKDRWGRDPFLRHEDKIFRQAKGKAAENGLPPNLRLDGIISDGKKALAIINGGFYRKNEMVNSFLIVGIGKDKITLEKNGRNFSLGIEKFAIESVSGGQKGGKE